MCCPLRSETAVRWARNGKNLHATVSRLGSDFAIAEDRPPSVRHLCFLCIFELLDGDEFRMSVTTSGIDAVAVELVTKGVDDALF